MRSHILRLLATLTLGLSSLGATCVVVEEGPEVNPYREESNAEASQEEMAEDVIRDSER
jgi:hypothetical protein